jgi:secondary thiamine-phosphate synthase enzyme
MKQAQHRMTVPAHGPGLHEVTRPIAEWLAARDIREGLLTIFVRHTSASLLIQENADPDVLGDLDRFFRRLAPEDSGAYRHRAEGPDDMPAHIKSALTQSQLSIPVSGGRMVLGTWQGIYLFEHRRAHHTRELALHIIGE